jgi:IS1 family transposase
MFLSFIGDRSNTFLQNVGNHLQDHPVSTQKTMTDNWQLYRIWPDLANTDYCMF